MFASLLRLFHLVWLLLRGHEALVLENLALHQQLTIYKRKRKRPRLTRWDRWFWIGLAGYWKGWRKHLFVVHPDTVVRWQRQLRFGKYWARLSTRGSKKLGWTSQHFCRKLKQIEACEQPIQAARS